MDDNRIMKGTGQAGLLGRCVKVAGSLGTCVASETRGIGSTCFCSMKTMWISWYMVDFGVSQRWMGCLQRYRILERGHKRSPVSLLSEVLVIFGNNIYGTTCAKRTLSFPPPCHSLARPGHASCAVDAFTDASDRCSLVWAPLQLVRKAVCMGVLFV